MVVWTSIFWQLTEAVISISVRKIVQQRGLKFTNPLALGNPAYIYIYIYIYIYQHI